MSISANIFIQNHPELFIESPRGNVKTEVQFVKPPDIAHAGALAFAAKPEQLSTAIQNQASLIIATPEAAQNLTTELSSQQGLLVVKNVQQAMTYILPYFNKKNSRLKQTPPIHPTAVISAGVKLGQNVTIGSHAFIGENVEIGDNTFVGASAVIETHAKIGASTVLHPLVFIGAYCEIGNHCEIHPHTSIGSDGYGYAPNLKGQVQKIPQIGNVVIEDFVEIGSGCAIDRATLTSTKIGMGTKLDNLCHIAHNVQIGKGCFLTALFSIAGSSVIGDYCTFGGRAGVADHVTLGNKITLAGNSIALKDLPEAGAYGGFPLQPMRSYLKTQATILQLIEMRKDLNKVLKQLNIETES